MEGTVTINTIHCFFPLQLVSISTSHFLSRILRYPNPSLYHAIILFLYPYDSLRLFSFNIYYLKYSNHFFFNLVLILLSKIKKKYIFKNPFSYFISKINKIHITCLSIIVLILEQYVSCIFSKCQVNFDL